MHNAEPYILVGWWLMKDTWNG